MHIIMAIITRKHDPFFHFYIVWKDVYVWSSGRAVERRTVNRRDGGSIPPAAVSKLTQFRSPHICLSELRDTKSRWSLLSGVYAMGSKRSHTGGNP